MLLVRAGFGIWPDYYGKLFDNPEDSGNYFNPGRLQRALNWALKMSDGYVWLFSSSRVWWVEGPDGTAPVPIYQGRRGLPLEYDPVLEAAKISAGSDNSSVGGVQGTVSLPNVLLPYNPTTADFYYDDDFGWVRILESAPLVGDANHDGVVSADDFAYVQSHFGNSGAPGILGDANWDGVVSADDFASVQANFGNHTPEPATMALLLLGGLGGLALPRRRL